MVTFKLPLIKIVSIYFLYILFSYSSSTTFYYYKGYIFNFFFYFILPLLLFSTVPIKKDINRYINLFLFIMVINEIISYGIFFNLWLAYKDGFPIYFMNHTYYSILIIISIIFIFDKFLHAKNMFFKISTLFFISTMIINLVVSGGRNGQVTLMLSLLTLSLFFLKLSIKKTLLIILIPIIIFTVSYIVFPNFHQRTNLIYQDTANFIQKDDYSSSVGTRLFSYKLLHKYLDSSSGSTVIFGSGTGSTKIIKNSLINQYFKGNESSSVVLQFNHFHQYYINTIVNFGIVGLILLFLFYFYIYKLHLNNIEISFYKSSILVIMIYSNLADGVLQERPIMLIFAFFIGIFISEKLNEGKNLNEIQN